MPGQVRLSQAPLTLPGMEKHYQIYPPICQLMILLTICNRGRVLVQLQLLEQKIVAVTSGRSNGSPAEESQLWTYDKNKFIYLIILCMLFY